MMYAVIPVGTGSDYNNLRLSSMPTFLFPQMDRARASTIFYYVYKFLKVLDTILRTLSSEIIFILLLGTRSCFPVPREGGNSEPFSTFVARLKIHFYTQLKFIPYRTYHQEATSGFYP